MTFSPPHQEPVNSFGDTQLIMAARDNDLAAVMKFLAEGACAQAANVRGRTALHHAAHHGNIDMMALLVERSASVNATTDHGSTPLQYAVFQGQEKAVEWLLARGALPDIADNKTRTVLHWAAARESIPIVKTLLRHGANPNIPGDEDLETPLIASCRKGRGIAAPALLGGNADPNIPDMHGATALHHAAILRNEALCELFIEHGADAGARDNAGHTACGRWPEIETIRQRVAEKNRAAIIAENHARRRKFAAARPGGPSL